MSNEKGPAMEAGGRVMEVRAAWDAAAIPAFSRERVAREPFESAHLHYHRVVYLKGDDTRVATRCFKSKVKSMLVMPANATGWFWHCLARETGRIGHLYSPGAQRGPWPWFPFALDNGAFSCWLPEHNVFDDDKWAAKEPEWRKLITWAAPTGLARWAIVPDVPGDAEATFVKWDKHYRYVCDAGILPALAVQDGMLPQDVRSLDNKPAVICVGGTTDWKWDTVAMWAEEFPRVHLLRCNSPGKLPYLESLAIESCDGTGWNRGDRRQTSGLENWARQKPEPKVFSLAPYVCRKNTNELFAMEY